MSDEERRKLVSTEQSLAADPEPKVPAAISGLEAFTLADEPDEDSQEAEPFVDADSLFNLPESNDDDDSEDSIQR
jgi:hypothetical protein